ncbi:MAG: FAD-dependent oxidoreductase [Alphaproteobacteria bacterium]
MPIMTATRTVRRDAAGPRRLAVDIAVLGAGIAGVSAALEAARLGRKVALIDAAPSLGGQSVAALIGTFCGLYANGPDPYQVTHGIADEILADLAAEGATSDRFGRNTRIVMYDEVALGRWIERKVLAESNIQPLLGAMLLGVERDGRRITALRLATRFGELALSAAGFIDASGDAALAWQAGLACREPADGPVYGTQMFVIEGLDEAAAPTREQVEARQGEAAGRYGLTRRDGFVFAFPGKGRALVNMTHHETPLDAVAMSRTALAGRREADKVLAFLKAEFPDAFADAAIRTYGLLGVRQTRWIAGRHQLTIDEVRGEQTFADAILRCSWPVELHDRAEGAYWEVFGDDHLHYVPLRSLTHDETDNLIAAGRCIDADVAALSTVRVMGPCIAMGAAAAHALDLAGAGSVHQIDVAALQRRLADNLQRTD